MSKTLSLAALYVVLGGGVAIAQTLRIDRDKVLAAVGELQPESIDLRPVLPGPGRVLRQSISRPGASSMRLHFLVAQQPAEASWHVEIVPSSGARQRYRPEPGETEFWTADIPGANAAIELFTTTAGALPLVLTIDQVVVPKPPIKPKSISGDNQLELYRVQAEPVRTLGRSVVRLRFVDDVKKKVFTCTGFLVFTTSHVLTNEHCINSDKEMRSALVDFDFDGGGVPATTVKLRRLLMSDAALDFSLLELTGPADRAVLALKSGGDTDGVPLIIVQHPGGEVKQISVRDCRVRGARMSGVSVAMTDFGHTCDTLGGSSGSPVFDSSTFTVVGLHHFGFFDGDPNPVNQAVRIPLVLEAIRKKFPTLTGPGTE
jgi:hypothetical protein